MHLNTDPTAPPRKPCIRDLHQLTTAPGALLPTTLVQIMSLKQLRRRVREINATHPQYQEETPLVMQFETNRRKRLSGELAVVHARKRTAQAPAAVPSRQQQLA